MLNWPRQYPWEVGKDRKR